MSPAFSNSLEKKKPYFTIVDKNQDHPKKPYFDVACFEVLEDDRFYSSLRYKKKAFFKGLVKFVRFEGKQKMEPFKLWKIKWDRSAKEFEKRNVDPDLFRHLLASSSFLVIGDLRNKPKGYGLENYQIVETDTHKVQQAQQNEYKKSLQPIVEFCKSIQYDMENLREYMFCRSCKAKRKYTLLSKENRYRNQAYYVCKSCAGKEVLKTLKEKNMEVSRTLKIYLRDLLKKYKNVNEVLNVFNPNFNIVEHSEATLVGVKKKKIKHRKIKAQSIYDFDIPNLLRLYFEKQGHADLLPVQIMALEKGLMERQDELIVAATSAGKTMIGEIAGIDKILRDKMAYLSSKNKKKGKVAKDKKPHRSGNPFSNLKSTDIRKLAKSSYNKNQKAYVRALKKAPSKSKMLYLVPIVALANMRHREYQELSRYGVNSALKVGTSFISGKSKKDLSSEFGSFPNADVVVGTYEAIDVLLRSGNPHLIEDVKTVVIDEIQMLADEGRGFKLDGLIARLRLYLPKAQMLYLSATIPQPKSLSKHLRSALIHYTDRPVAIERHLVICMNRQAKKRNIRQLIRHEYRKKSSFGFKGQTIVFTNSRRNTEKLAEFLQKNHVPAGAYHGGLNHQQRKSVEKKFEKQRLACVVTTAALAAGVDFPASQVVFHSLVMGIKTLSVADFEQMSGRAGRFKKHDRGKVYLLVTPGKSTTALVGENEEDLAVRLLKGKMAPLELPLKQNALHAEVLATISMYSSAKRKETGISLQSLNMYHSHLFNGGFSMEYALRDLLSNRYVRKIKTNKGERFRTTKFGKAVASSFLGLDEADYIRSLLQDPVDENNPPPDPVLIAMHLEEYNNVYITNRLLADLRLQSQGRTGSNNLFSNSVLQMTEAEHLGKKGRNVPRKVFEIIVKWEEDIFNCSCEEKPYCECGKLNVAGYILDYRLSGMSIREIAQTLKDLYEIKVFMGDLLGYLEAIIYDLLAIEKIGRSLKIHPATRRILKTIPETVDVIVRGPKAKQSEEPNYINKVHQKRKYARKKD